MSENNRIHGSIVAIAIFNFSWLIFSWLSPDWRALADFLKSVHMAGFDAYGITALTLLLVCLGIFQVVRRGTPGNVVRWKVDVIIASAWVVTYGAIVVKNLSSI